MRLAYGCEETVAAWARQEHGFDFQPPFTCLAMVEGEQIVGAVVFNNYTGPDIEGSVMGDTQAFSPRMVRACFRYVFRQLGCVRATVRTRKSNIAVQEMAARLGFQREGLMRRYYGDDDAVVFGMLREECRWLRN